MWEWILPTINLALIAASVVLVGYMGWELWKTRNRFKDATESWVSKGDEESLARSMRRLAKSSGALDVTLANATAQLEAGVGVPWEAKELMMCDKCLIVGLVGKLAHDAECPNNKSGWANRG